MNDQSNVLKSAVVNFSVSNFNEVLTNSVVANLANSPEIRLAAPNLNQLDPSKLAGLEASSLAEILRGVVSELSSSKVAEILCSAVACLSASQVVNISRSAMANIAETLKDQSNISPVEVKLTGDPDSIKNIVSTLDEWNKKADLSITGDTPVK